MGDCRHIRLRRTAHDVDNHDDTALEHESHNAHQNIPHCKRIPVMYIARGRLSSFQDIQALPGCPALREGVAETCSRGTSLTVACVCIRGYHTFHAHILLHMQFQCARIGPIM